MLLLLVLVACGAAHGCGPDSDTQGTEQGATCTFDGHVYASGDSWPAGDGCNTCSCHDGGVECTDLYCRGDSGDT